MEEKERRIREIMKDCKGQTIYSIIEGDVRFDGFEDDRVNIHIGRNDMDVSAELFLPSGRCVFFPSEESSYREPVFAWEEWKRLQTLKYTVNVRIETFGVDKDGRTQNRNIPYENYVKGLSNEDKEECVNKILSILSGYELPF